MFLDHIVHFISESPQTAVDYWKKQGMHAALGGRHLNWGTHNALFYTKDSYIEWLAVEKPEVAESANHPLTELLLHDKIGFGTICLRTDSMAELNNRLNGEGFETSGVLDAERKTDTGELIQWKMLFIKEQVTDQLPYPFFIEWQESDEQRYESLRKRGAIAPANEELAIERLVFGVKDPEAAKRKWLQILGGSLELPNCRIEFRHTEQKRERLEEVCFAQGEKRLSFEGGVYRLTEHMGV
ncbi:VOC family protein [Planococcus sp. 1R117A]|uniref:VOC family protein n=1 Tax=Planococcus sp. 1R117A TaxID=3447020 RepID=UPI003EDBDA9A